MSKNMDFVELASGVDQMREVLAALVAGLVADGFTDREARCIVAGMFASQTSGNTEEGS